MSDNLDPRAAGLSITNAHRHLKASFGEIAQLLRTADAQFDSGSPRMLSLDGAVTWERSASLANPEQWIPKFFRRFWREAIAPEHPTRWRRAVALDIWVDVEGAIHGTDEPYIGCYAFGTDEPDGIEGWWGEWIGWIGETEYAMRWEPGYENRAFAPSRLVKVQKGQTFEVSGYFLKLTDIRSAEDLSRMVTGPLISLTHGWSIEKLPHPLPEWSFSKA